MPGLGQGEDLPAVRQAGLQPNLLLLLMQILFHWLIALLQFSLTVYMKET